MMVGVVMATGKDSDLLSSGEATQDLRSALAASAGVRSLHLTPTITDAVFSSIFLFSKWVAEEQEQEQQGIVTQGRD